MKFKHLVFSGKAVAIATAGVVGVAAVAGGTLLALSHSGEAEAAAILANKWPSAFSAVSYVEPEFTDDEARTNNAFNVKDFGPQGTNGWFYRYGKAEKPTKSKQMEGFDEKHYFQRGETGMEIKKDFLHTAEGTAPILEWRAAEKGAVNIELAYVKNVNGDKNPSYPDGVTLYVYKGDELLKAAKVDALRNTENIVELAFEDVAVEEEESLYFAIDPNENNAYDGGSLYVAINDVNTPGPTAMNDTNRTNDTNNIDDFGAQGENGWTYLCGNVEEGFDLVSIKGEEGYMNAVSPTLAINQSFIHPSINDDAALGWKPVKDGTVEIRMKYTKFLQADGNPDYPDGVTVSAYLNDKLLYQEDVKAPKIGENVVTFRKQNLKVTKADQLYFVVSSKENVSYDGGCFDIDIIARDNQDTENTVAIPNDESRTNNADAMADFGPQGNNGWFFQEGYGDDPFDAVNMTTFNEEEHRYEDNSFLEIKGDYANTGKHKKAAVIKWKVAQTGTINIASSYTKLLNEDKNPSWPDGTRVTLYHNKTVLKQEEFAADRENEITKDLSVDKLAVEKGDFITLVINGKENNAYDGGLYALTIEDAVKHTVSMVNNGTENVANLKSDFGQQGSNGWYYSEGKNVNEVDILTKKTADGNGYLSSKGANLEIKDEFVQPRMHSDAMYHWVVAKDGTIDISGLYVKFGHEDPNESFPDGVILKIYKNSTELKNVAVGVKVGEGNNTKEEFDFRELSVKKGDVFTFAIAAGENNAWDGGKLAVQIKPHTEGIKYAADSDLEANIMSDFGEQGVKGWYYGYGYGDRFDFADLNGEEYSSAKVENLLLKKDGVHPGKDAPATYRWIAGKDGSINLFGRYNKSKNEGGDDKPDGVVVTVYKNGTAIDGMTYAIAVSRTEEIAQIIRKNGILVKKGDILDFVVDCKGNSDWDYGRLDMDITETKAVVEEEETEKRTNHASLKNDFGEQGSNGWNYGICDWNGENFELLAYDEEANRYYNNGKPEIKADFVEPGNGRNAAYQWTAAEDGRVRIKGSYTKFANFTDPAANGVCMRIFLNKSEQKFYGVTGQFKTPRVIQIDETIEVLKGDTIKFSFDQEGDNDSLDGGKLVINIFPADENAPVEDEDKVDAGQDDVEETNPSDDGEETTPSDKRTNYANLKNDFGEQGSNGWNYGMCDWDGKNLSWLTYNEVDHRYFNDGKPELKADFVEPGTGKNAAYQWTAAETGDIVITGKLVKFANADDRDANGVCARIFKNGHEEQWLGLQGNFAEEKSVEINKEFYVEAGDTILFAIDADGNDAWDGCRLEIDIRPKNN